MRNTVQYFFVLLICVSVVACSPFKKAFIKKHIDFTESIHQDHIGFVLYDMETNSNIYTHNADKYFTPASNVKVFTLYTGLLLLKDKVPGLEYIVSGDSLIFWGTGDPSFLNRKTANDAGIFNFLKNSNESLYYSSAHYNNEPLGPGWAWDDYQYTFSAERSPFPIHGNAITVGKRENEKLLHIDVPYFKRYFYLGDSTVEAQTINRAFGNNQMRYHPKTGAFLQSMPFRSSDHLVSRLLSDTLKRDVSSIRKTKPRNTKILYSVPTDSLYKVMMQDSDNFIAEQLLLTSGSTLGDTLNTAHVIDYMTTTYLYDLPDEPVWVDGSGLSRYNLVTPRTMVALWQKIYNEVDQERLFKILAVGGESGTLKNYYQGDSPYIYGKTGTLSNNHNLSGFIRTKSGKVLVFCYMNNNYTVPSVEVKASMERLMEEIRYKF